MYRPAHFREDDPAVLAGFVDAHPLAAVVASTPAGMIANHLPLLRLTDADNRTLLRGHVARGNELWRAAPAQSAVLAIFSGRDAYVSPAWYPTKAETGEVVPTWNYSVVHAHGRITFFEDAQWLRAIVGALTTRHEAGRATPWQMSDAPERYIERMLAAIVGFEIRVDRFEGKFKASQNRTERERRGVEAGLEADGRSPDEARALVRPPR